MGMILQGNTLQKNMAESRTTETLCTDKDNSRLWKILQKNIGSDHVNMTRHGIVGNIY